MARNIAGYISNLGKSVAYSAVDKVKQMSPTTGEFVSSNAELFKSMYSNIRDYKGTYSRGLSIVQKSKVYEAADLGIKSLFEDIKTGKLYNREREDRIASKIMGFDNDSGFGSFDSDDMNFDDSDDFGSWDDSSITTGDKLVTASIIDSSRNNADMVSMAVAKSAEHITRTQKSSTHLLYTQNLQAYNIFNNNLNAINSNISNILDFSTSTIQTHAQNSSKYFEETTKLLQDQTALLRQIVENTSPKVEQQKETKRKTTFSDVVGVNGAPNLNEYFNLIKRNVSEQLGALGAMNSMFGEDSNTLLSFVASPLKFIPNYIVNKTIPKTLEKSMEQFDKSLSGFFGSLISKFNTMANDEDNIITSTIGKIFGVRNSVKSSIDTANYNKGKVDWDGKSRKALIEVIPTQLAKIISLLSGKNEQIYDYDKGQFIDSKTIRDSYDNIRKTNSRRATSDMRDVFDKYMQNLTFGSLREKELLQEDISKFFDQLYSSGEVFDMFGKNSKDGYLKYGIDPKSFAVIRAMFKNSEKHLQHSINKQILEYRDRENQQMMELENSGDSIYAYRFNNSNLGEFSNKKNAKNIGGSLLSSVDNKGHNVFFYLQNIYKELSFMRRFGQGNSSISDEEVSRIIMSDGTGHTFNRHTLNDIDIPDKSAARTQASNERKERERKIAKFEREQARRRQKNSSLINISDFDNEDELEKSLSAMIKTNRIKDELDENKDKKKSLLDRLLEANNVSGKMEVVVDNLNRLSKKPMDFITNTINKVDQRMYEVIYGKEDYKGQDVKGFIDIMVLELKSTFGKFNLWLDEKVLEPLKEKIDIQSFNDLGKKFLGMFGIDGDEIGKSIKEYLFGKENGLFTSINNNIKNTFKATLSTIKQSVKDAYGPLFGKIKSGFKTKSKFANLDEVAEFFEDISWDQMTPEQKMKEIQRQRSLENVINTTRGINKASNYYNENSFDYSKTSPSSYRNHLMAEIKNSQFSNMSRAEKQQLLDKLMDRYTDPTKSSRQSMYGVIQRLQHELDNESKISNIDRYLQTKDSLKKIKEAREFGRIQINEEYFNKPAKSAKELYEMFPNLISSPDIAQSIRDTENTSSGNLFNTILNKVTEGIDLLKDMKDSLITIVKSITPKNTRGFSKPSVFNSINTPFSSNPLLREEEGAINDFAKELGGIISHSIAGYMHGKLNKFADGGYVSEAQVATIGKGEVVLSKENVDNLVKVLSGVMDGVKKSKAKSADKLYSSLKKLDQEVGGFSDLSVLDQLLTQDSRLSGRYNSLSNTGRNDISKIINVVNDQLTTDRNTTVDERGLPVDPVQRAAFLETRPYLQQVGEEFTKAVSVTRNALFGNAKEDRKSFGLVMDDITTNITRYAPEAISSGLLGAGVSLVTGAVGGPLLGAAVGAGISLTKNSEKVQNWLFGEEDKNGDRTGGVIPRDFMKSITKYLPDFKTYGIAGAATGLLPLVPFGPIGGLMLGSAFAFAKNNEAVQEALFGGKEHSLMKPETKEKLKRMLPRIGLGAGIGMLAGPFGLLGNAIVGSGIGMLSSTDKFNQLILGEKDKEGEYQGGLLPTIRDTVVNPIKGYMKGLGKRVTDFTTEKLLKPVQSAFAPIKKDFELLIKGMFDKVGNILNNLFEKSFGVTLNKMIEDKLIKPLSKFVGAVFNPVKWLGKKIISAPSALIGAYGNSRRKAHIRSGNADYMTAQERLQFRQDHNIYTMGLFGNDYYYERDKALAGMGQEDLLSTIAQLRNIQSAGSDNMKARKQSANDMAKDIMPHFGYTESKNIMRALRDGDLDSVIDYINKNPKFSQETKQSLRKSLYTKFSKYQENETKRLSDIENKDSIFNKLRSQGIDVNDKNIKKYLNLLDKEYKSRQSTANSSKQEPETVEERSLELQEVHHNKIVDLFTEVIDILKGKGTTNTDQTTSNSGMNIRNMPNNLSIRGRRERKQVLGEDGSVTEFVKNSRGEWVPDMSDSSTIEEINRNEEDRNLRNNFFERFNSIFQAGKQKVSDGVNTVKEKGGNLFSNLFGGIKSFLTIGGLILTGITAFMKTPTGENLLLSIGKKIGSTITSFLGDGLKAILGIGDGGEDTAGSAVANTAASAIGYEDAEDLGDEGKGVLARYIATGGATSKFGLKSLFKIKESDGIIKKALKTPANLVGKAANLGAKTVTKLYSKTTDKLLTKSSSLFENLSKSASGIKETILEKGSKFASKTVDFVNDTTSNSELIQSMVKSIKEFMEKIFTNSIVQNIVGSAKASKIISEFIPKIVKEISERAAKQSTKAISKVIGGLSTGGILNIAWAVADFVSGFNDAKNILQIVQEPTFGMKVCTGLLKALNGLFIVTAFIPEKTWVNLILDGLLPMLGEEDTKLQQLREESKQITEKYAQETGRKSVTVEEYNKETKKSWVDKLKEGTSKLWKNIKSLFGGNGTSSSKLSSTTTTNSDIEGYEAYLTDSSIRTLAGNGNSSRSSLSSLRNTNKASNIRNYLAGNGASKQDIRYMELNAPVKETVTAKDIDNWVNPIVKNKSGSAMKDIGSTAIKAYKATGLDPRYLVAHAAWESGWGTSNFAKNRNNFFGIGAFNSDPNKALKFSKDEGFIDGAKWINHNFTARGQNTLQSMIYEDTGTHRYAVYDDGSPNEGWINGISSIMAGSNTITSGSINKNAKWDGKTPTKDYTSTGSTAKNGSNLSDVDSTNEASSEEDSESNSIFNMFSDLSTALTSDFNKLFGFDDTTSTSSTDSDDDSSSSSSSSGSSSADKVNGFTYFSQKESPWATHKYNLSPGNYQAPNRDVSLARRGCGPTSAAMVIRELTGNKNVNPATIADYSTSVGSSVDAGTAWDFFGKAATKYGLNMTALGQTATKDYLTKATKKKPIIISGTGGPNGTKGGPFYGGHFVVGVQGSKDSITINDPVGRTQSKTYKMKDIAPYVKAGWTFDRGGGNGDPTPTTRTTPNIQLPHSEIAGNGPSDSTSSSSNSYEKLLISIIEVLMKISDNSSYLSKIVDILSEKLGVEVPEETKKSIRNNSSSSKQQIVNLLRQSANEGNNDNEYLLNLLDNLAKQ